MNIATLLKNLCLFPLTPFQRGRSESPSAPLHSPSPIWTQNLSPHNRIHNFFFTHNNHDMFPWIMSNYSLVYFIIGQDSLHASMHTSMKYIHQLSHVALPPPKHTTQFNPHLFSLYFFTWFQIKNLDDGHFPFFSHSEFFISKIQNFNEPPYCPLI